jgi:tRNA dimethylallyltransferase
MVLFTPEKKKPLLIVITGPTAVGKTQLAFNLALKLSNAEIISCDSMAVYKEMNIGTSKPCSEMREKISHHMIDICSVKDEFNVAEYVRLAKQCIQEIIQRGKIPVIVGGSLLYLYSLLDGIFQGPGKNPQVREELFKMAQAQGLSVLYTKLSEIDPETAQKIHPNDFKRIVRALEVWYTTGEKISELKKRKEGIYEDYEVKIFALIKERKKIYQTIDNRVDDMITQGLVEEVKKLWEQGISITAYQGHGYKEIIGYLEDKYNFEEAIRLTKRNTRRYAKRQISWLKRDNRVRWINLDEFKNDDQVIDCIIGELNI